MKIRAYKNYGVLNNEKKNIFTVSSPASTAVAYDEIEIDIPEEFQVFENNFGSLLIKAPNGKTYFADEIIGQVSEGPALMWYDNGMHCVKCEYVEV